MRVRSISLVVLLLIAGCKEQSQVQASYNIDKDYCQSSAAGSVNSTSGTSSRATRLKNAFSECMKKEGWKLSTAKAPTTITQPISTPSGPGIMSATAAPASAAKTGAAATAASTTGEPIADTKTTAEPKTTVAPSQGLPVTNAPSALPQGASTYQPSTPPPGAAPGRYFGPRE